MFNLSTQDVVSSIEKSPLEVNHGAYFQEYKDFFGKTFTLPDIQHRNFVSLELQEDRPRRRLDPKDELMLKLRIFFMHSAITKALESKFNTNLKFKSVDLWRDNKGYHLLPHVDDPRIKLALQIYLGDDNIGTSLYKGDTVSQRFPYGTVTKTFPFKMNCGYALLNNPDSFHGLENSWEIPKDGRLSLYARYS